MIADPVEKPDEETGRWRSSRPAGIQERGKEERREIGIGGEIIEAESEGEKEPDEDFHMSRMKMHPVPWGPSACESA